MQLQHSRSSGRVIRNAMGQYNRIAEVIEELRVFSERVKLMESEPERMMGLRQLVIDNDSAFYVIEDMDVIVTRVLYSAMNISRRLLEDNEHIQ